MDYLGKFLGALPLLWCIVSGALFVCCPWVLLCSDCSCVSGWMSCVVCFGGSLGTLTDFGALFSSVGVE